MSNRKIYFLKLPFIKNSGEVNQQKKLCGPFPPGFICSLQNLSICLQKKNSKGLKFNSKKSLVTRKSRIKAPPPHENKALFYQKIKKMFLKHAPLVKIRNVVLHKGALFATFIFFVVFFFERGCKIIFF